MLISTGMEKYAFRALIEGFFDGKNTFPTKHCNTLVGKVLYPYIHIYIASLLRQKQQDRTDIDDALKA